MLEFNLAKDFRKNNYNVVISDILTDTLDNAGSELSKIKSDGEILKVVCDVTKESDLIKLFDMTVNKFGSIDILINNAGVNWLTNRKTMFRFMTSSFNKRDFFN